MAQTTQRYGWHPDLPDQRDYVQQVAPELLKKLPPQVDLRSGCPPVYDQGQLGSCTSNAAAGALEFDQLKQQLAAYVPSRLFIYYNTRVIEGTADVDAGASLRDTCKAIHGTGYCDEMQWPYDISQYAIQPPQDDYTVARPNAKITYKRVPQNVVQMRGVLASGLPFIIGFTVYESFESADVAATGVVPMPGPNEAVLGGHAVLAVGYDDATSRFNFRNSWGDSWGDSGYGTIPYIYLTNRSLAGDFWTISHVVG